MNNLKNTKKRIWLVIFVSQILLSLPFIVDRCGFLLLFAFVPLLFIDDICLKEKIKRVWIYYFSFFFLWNLITTYWIYNATIAGAIAAVVLNSLQMSVVFGLFRAFRKRLMKWKYGSSLKFLPYIFLVVTWLAWEHCYYEAEVSWPWLVLGNGFARSVRLIQWYEYTGTLGGSLWILISNILLFKTFIVRENADRKRYVALLASSVATILLPMILSLIMYCVYEETDNPREFVVLQPNIDPYHDKFINMSRATQDNILLDLARSATTDSTLFIIAPETFTSYINEDYVLDFPTVVRIEEFLQQYPGSNFIFGAVSLKKYPWNSYPGSSSTQRPTLTSRKGEGYWYDAFNSSFIIDSNGNFDIFHKSKLVVLAEFFPFPKLLAPFENLALNLGGTVSSYATQPEITIFTANDGTQIGTAICYESVYGDYYRDYVRKGAKVMTVITNDGWWGNTPGYHQHLSYSSLRAIETRRSIARSANTGISALINQRGDIVDRTQWWVPAFIRGELNLNDKITFFVKVGDVIGIVSVWTFLLLAVFYCSLLFFTISSPRNNKQIINNNNKSKYVKHRNRR